MSGFAELYFQTNFACSRQEQEASETQRNAPLNPTYAYSPESVVIREEKIELERDEFLSTQAYGVRPCTSNLMPDT